MRYTVIGLLLLIGLTPPAWADFRAAMSAYDRGDYAAALAELQPLAQQGNAGAQYWLGRMYARGEGTVQDFVEAHAWLNLAASRGYPDAQRLRDEVAGRMTPEQLARAQTLARQWQPGGGAPGAAPTATPAAAPVDRTAIRDIQAALNRLGYDAGPADGLMGGRTRSAIRQYQTDNRLAVTGEPSRDLLERLSQSLSQAPTPPPAAEETDKKPPRNLTGKLARLVDKAEKQRAADAWVIYDLKAVVEEGRGQRRRDPALVQEQIARIQSLAEEAQNRQAADQWLVDDLNALVAEHSGPQWRIVAQDAFQDGDYASNPAWTVASGSFRVEPGLGLRSIVKAPAAAEAQAPKETRPEEIGLAILGSVLQQALGPQGQPPAAGQETDRAEIYLSQPIGNAFRVRVEMSSRQGQGALILGPYQGGDRRVSYRLAYLPGSPRGLELVRLTHSGSSVVGAYRSPLKLEDGRLHVLEWTRTADGNMTVALDGREVIRADDQGINDPFDGFTVVNRGGDYALNEVAIAVSE